LFTPKIRRKIPEWANKQIGRKTRKNPKALSFLVLNDAAKFLNIDVHDLVGVQGNFEQ